LEKCVGHSLKLLDIDKTFGPLPQTSSPPLVSQAGYEPGFNQDVDRTITTE